MITPPPKKKKLGQREIESNINNNNQNHNMVTNKLKLIHFQGRLTQPLLYLKFLLACFVSYFHHNRYWHYSCAVAMMEEVSSDDHKEVDPGLPGEEAQEVAPAGMINSW